VSFEFLWYIPNQNTPGHRGEPVTADHNSLGTLTSQARALEEHGWRGALLGAGWGRPDTAGPGRPRVVAGRVIVPLDSADAHTRRKYREYQASRHQRTLAPIGERRILIARDLVGTSAEIVEWLRADPVLTEATELQLELPYAFAHEDYEQIVSDVAASIAPQLGWSPTAAG
jgi:hypothetical protein